MDLNIQFVKKMSMLVQVCCESAKFRAACIMEMSVKHENYITDGHSSYIFSTAKSCVYG